MNADKFEIDVNDDSCVNKNSKWFFATLGSITKVIVSKHEIYLFLNKKCDGVWIDCRDISGKKKWMLIDCSIDPSAYDDNKRIEYQANPPDLTVRPSAHAIYYKNKEIYVTSAMIEWVLFVDGQIYVLSNDYKTHRNIHCIDTKGKYLWQVEPFDYEDWDHYYYTSVTYEKGRIWASSIACYYCCLDPETGKITEKVFGK